MTRVLIVYYSRTGNTKAMCEAAAEGASSEGAEVICLPVEKVTDENLLCSEAIIMGSPCYFGTMAASLKEFWDNSVRIRPRLEGKIGAAIATSGHYAGGNETTLLSIHQAMLIHGMLVLGDPISTGGHYGAASFGRPSPDHLNVAKALGARTARIAAKICNGS